MRKKLIIAMSIITTLAINTPVFALEKEVSSINNVIEKTSNIYTLNSENILISDLQPFMIAENQSVKVITPEIGWVGSIFITGLGQIIMGDFWRGAKFWGFIIIGAVALSLITGNGSLSGSVAGVIGHIWSIIDAYQMAEDRAIEKAKLLSNNKKLEELAKTLDKFSVSNNKIQFNLAKF
ncbi:MAG: hypothetical protein U0457_06560 [Candidatus Sericytochromatia bacterium]